MKKFKLDDMKGGWFVGNFEPSVMKADFEVGIHRHKKGEFHQDHFHKKGTEINVIPESDAPIIPNATTYQGDSLSPVKNVELFSLPLVRFEMKKRIKK